MLTEVEQETEPELIVKGKLADNERLKRESNFCLLYTSPSPRDNR